MKKRMKKVLSGVSAAALVFGTVSSYVAFAEAGDTEAATEVSTLDALKTAIDEGKKDIIITGTITVGEPIDLTGVTLTAAATAGTWTDGCVIKMTDGGKITGGSINGIGRDLYVINVTGGTATLEDVMVDNQPLTGLYPDHPEVTKHSTIRNNGTLTLTGCTIKSGDPAAVKNEENTTLNVNGGTITGKTIGITNFGTTTLDGGAEVRSESGSTAIYALTYDTFDSKTTVKDATVDGTIVYGGYGTAGNGGKATKTPTVEIGEDAVLVNSGFGVSGNDTMVKLPVDGNGDPKPPTLTIDPDAEVQLASTEDLDPVLVNALRDVKNITDSEGKPLEVNEDGKVVAVQFDVTLPVSFTNGAMTADVAKAAAGTKVTLTVTPDTGYALDRLTLSALVNGESTIVETTEEEDGTYTFTMPAGHVIVSATFAAEYTITIGETENGTVTTAPAGKTVKGTEVTVTATPDDGYELDALTYTVDNGEPVEITDGKFVMPEGNVTVNATFKESDSTGDDNTGDDNTGDNNTGDDNSGDSNTGDDNSGDNNTGDDNSGDNNTGDNNTGDSNTGDNNTGDSNTGDDNTGDDNTGDSNTGDDNTGDSNTGDSNTGDDNSGDDNTGDDNTGDSNTGDSNTGDSNTGDSNTGDDNNSGGNENTPGGSTNDGNSNGSNDNKNPETGIALAVTPVILAGAMTVVAVRKNRK